MSIGRKILGVMGIVLAAVIIASTITLLCASDDDRAEIIGLVLPEQTEEGVRQIDWDALPPEVIAWVEVPGTAIDEPIVQATPEAPNAYLYIDALEQGAYGTPYIDCECSLDTDFVMVYGHHMSDGSAFADFANYIEEGYARDHLQIIIYERSGEILKLEAVAVDAINASREKLSIPKPEQFQERTSACDLILKSDMETDQLWAFATCSYQTWNSRTIVYGIDAMHG